MSQTAIPNEFAKYMQNQISVGLAPDMNEMIFAYIPDLDPSQPIDLTQGLPNVATWVHQQNIDQLGKLGDNALVYSTIIKGEEEFTFNAIYLRDKNVPNSCGMVVHKAEETKELGSTLTRSLMMEYVNAAQIVGVIDDAATWQIDYQARLKGMDEDLRLACLDNYGHTGFVDGFDVTQQADPNKYKITPGVVYVGGLRAVLSGEVLQTITTKPNGIYIDVVRDGTALSAWENTLTIKVSTTQLNDYVDAAGRKHYVAKLAGINANGSVVDWRVKGASTAIWCSMPIGHPFALALHIPGVEPPPTDNSKFRYIKLSSNDPYNNATLINEVVTGTAPVLSVTAEINFPQSTMHGQRIELRNTSKVFSRAGQNGGVVVGDTIRNMTGGFQFYDDASDGNAVGAFAGEVLVSGVKSAGVQGFRVNNTFEASRVVPTSNQNQPVHIEEPYFMRIF
ncbi:phage tail protein [Vibrio aestuarianus]|uniref:phage tail-collar fiber domain-containing protein n=1 Tax=Vibrio aestuarianus TaxID=28171 RepID=UPI00237C71CE|nr:phage tail protein [Vibrio aestuarianus]MDE1328507.1 phage tail protein [Vibrio aestuarianus]